MQGEHAEEDRAARARCRGASARAATPIASQPGALAGSWKSANGSRIRPPAEHRAGREHRARASPRPPAARRRRRPRTRATRATTASAPTIGPRAAAGVDARSRPRRRRSRSRARAPRVAAQPLVREHLSRMSALKIGTDAWSDGGQPGVDVLLAPGDQPERQRGVERRRARGSAATRPAARRRRASGPSRQARYASRTAAAQSVRTAIIGAGAMSSTATLMKRYDAPQIGGEQEQHRPVAVHLRTVPVPEGHSRQDEREPDDRDARGRSRRGRPRRRRAPATGTR